MKKITLITFVLLAQIGFSQLNQTSISNTEIKAIDTYNNYVLVISNNGVYVSDNNGVNYTLNNSLPQGQAYNHAAINEFTGTFYVTSFVAGNSAKLYESVDQGNTWQEVTVNLTAATRINTIDFSQNAILIGTNNEGILYSDNNGLNWSKKNVGLPTFFEDPSQLEEITIVKFLSGGDILAGTYNKGIYRANSTSLTWSSFNNGLRTSTLGYYPISNIDELNGKVYITAKNDGLYSSAALSTNWSFETNVDGAGKYASVIVRGNVVYYSNSSIIYYSDDNGVTWKTISNTTNAEITTLSFNNNFLLIGTDTKGLFLKPLSALSGIEEVILNGLNIYPNPSNGIFNIDLSSVKSDVSSIEIINGVGQVVFNLTTLTSIQRVDISDFNSGVYFVNFKLNNGQTTAKKIFVQ